MYDAEYVLNTTVYRLRCITPSMLVFGMNQRTTDVNLLRDWLERNESFSVNIDILREKAVKQLGTTQKCNEALNNKGVKGIIIIMK